MTRILADLFFCHFDEGEITPRKQRTAWLSKCDFYFVEMTNFINNLKKSPALNTQIK